MTDTMLDIPPDFVEHVQDCLSRLYDYAFLQDHPIVALLTPGSSPTQRVQVFRQTVIDAIEHFSPGSKINFDLDDCDKVLRVEGNNLRIEKVMTLVMEKGFLCTVLD